jgi:hypothetical protein
MAQELAQYLEDSGQLIRDPAYRFNSKSQMVRWINRGRRTVAKAKGCIRILIAGTSPVGISTVPGTFTAGAGIAGTPIESTFQTIPNVEVYSFDFANQYLRKTTQGIKGIIDVLDLAISWGAERPTMTWYPWDMLQALARSYNSGVTSYPLAWARQADGDRGQVYLFPVPSVICEMEWDCICVPSDLNTNDDFDALPGIFHDSVAHFAAAMAFASSGRYQDAEYNFAKFSEQSGIARKSAAIGTVPNYYWESDLP